MALAGSAEALGKGLIPLKPKVKEEYEKRRKAVRQVIEDKDDRRWLNEWLRKPELSFSESLTGLHSLLDRRCQRVFTEFFGEDWPVEFARARNYYAHGSERQAELDEVHLDLMARCLEVLIRFNLLNFLSLRDQEMREAISRDPGLRDLEYTTVEKIAD